MRVVVRLNYYLRSRTVGSFSSASIDSLICFRPVDGRTDVTSRQSLNWLEERLDALFSPTLPGYRLVDNQDRLRRRWYRSPRQHCVRPGRPQSLTSSLKQTTDDLLEIDPIDADGSATDEQFQVVRAFY
jgi:hypothetical protein